MAGAAEQRELAVEPQFVVEGPRPVDSSAQPEEQPEGRLLVVEQVERVESNLELE